jgi:hypothetical protein
MSLKQDSFCLYPLTLLRIHIMVLPNNLVRLALLASSVLVGAAPAQHGSRLPANAQNLLGESMRWMDTFYDSSESYLYELSAAAALRHETRSSVWYALGLLARNEKDDVDQAESIICNVVGAQFKNPSEQWYDLLDLYFRMPV